MTSQVRELVRRLDRAWRVKEADRTFETIRDKVNMLEICLWPGKTSGKFEQQSLRGDCRRSI